MRQSLLVKTNTNPHILDLKKTDYKINIISNHDKENINPNIQLFPAVGPQDNASNCVLQFNSTPCISSGNIFRKLSEFGKIKKKNNSDHSWDLKSSNQFEIKKMAESDFTFGGKIPEEIFNTKVDSKRISNFQKCRLKICQSFSSKTRTTDFSFPVLRKASKFQQKKVRGLTVLKDITSLFVHEIKDEITPNLKSNNNYSENLVDEFWQSLRAFSGVAKSIRKNTIQSCVNFKINDKNRFMFDSQSKQNENCNPKLLSETKINLDSGNLIRSKVNHLISDDLNIQISSLKERFKIKQLGFLKYKIKKVPNVFSENKKLRKAMQKKRKQKIKKGPCRL